MGRPNENSTIEEIKSYKPQQFIDAMAWGLQKPELLRKKMGFIKRLFDRS